jgi:hypothetical protein
MECVYKQAKHGAALRYGSRRQEGPIVAQLAHYSQDSGTELMHFMFGQDIVALHLDREILFVRFLRDWTVPVPHNTSIPGGAASACGDGRDATRSKE